MLLAHGRVLVSARPTQTKKAFALSLLYALPLSLPSYSECSFQSLLPSACLGLACCLCKALRTLGSPGILMTKTDAGALPKPRNSSSEAMRRDGTRVGSRHPCEAAACLPDVPEAQRREEVRREVRGWDQQGSGYPKAADSILFL